MSAMSIRADFQATVDEFISDLHSFATGDYLQEDEKEFWEAPFDAAALPELKAILEAMLDAFDKIPDDPEGEVLAKVAQPFIDQLMDFNTKYADAVLEPEEKADLADLLHDAAAATGADDEALRALPEID